MSTTTTLLAALLALECDVVPTEEQLAAMRHNESLEDDYEYSDAETFNEEFSDQETQTQLPNQYKDKVFKLASIMGIDHSIIHQELQDEEDTTTAREVKDGGPQKPKTPRFKSADRQRFDVELKRQHLPVTGSWTRQHLNKFTLRSLRELWTIVEGKRASHLKKKQLISELLAAKEELHRVGVALSADEA